MTEKSIPVPDPTVLTTELTLRSVGAVKELFETRLNAMDKAISLLQAFADKSPTTAAVALSVEALRELMLEKFIGIKTQITERDVQTEKASKDVKGAVDAAFAAAKEAVGEQNKSNALSITKSEAATTKQIDGILELLKTTAKAVDDKIADIKDRLTSIESRTVATTEVKKDGRDSISLLVAGIAVAVAIASLFYRHT